MEHEARERGAPGEQRAEEAGGGRPEAELLGHAPHPVGAVAPGAADGGGVQDPPGPEPPQHLDEEVHRHGPPAQLHLPVVNVIVGPGLLLGRGGRGRVVEGEGAAEAALPAGGAGGGGRRGGGRPVGRGGEVADVALLGLAASAAVVAAPRLGARRRGRLGGQRGGGHGVGG